MSAKVPTVRHKKAMHSTQSCKLQVAVAFLPRDAHSASVVLLSYVVRPSIRLSNRKLHTHFRLVPKSTTLDDLEGHYAPCFKTRASLEPTTKI